MEQIGRATTAQVLEVADVASYAAKQHGRNRVVAPGVDTHLSGFSSGSSGDRTP